MNVVDAIATVSTDYNDKPVTDVVIEWVRFAQVEDGAFTTSDNIFDTETESESKTEVDTSSETETHAPHEAPAYEDIDFSELTTLDGVTESDTPTDYVMIKVKDKGDIVIRLYPDVAPATVANFKKLVSEKFYDGLIFHRVIKNFMIQGGDPDGNGTGGSDKTIIGEFSSNGFDNNLNHKRGVVSMARATSPNSASSQFFIVHQTSPHLDGKYASFGYVVYGMDVVDSIAKVTTNYSDRPHNDVVMTSVRFVNVPEAE
jgi:peptidyl-prolyl cis-trans isomerase B (cyclophilin B)